jgi:hypothetical protein
MRHNISLEENLPLKLKKVQVRKAKYSSGEKETQCDLYVNACY